MSEFVTYVIIWCHRGDHSKWSIFFVGVCLTKQSYEVLVSCGGFIVQVHAHASGKESLCGKDFVDHSPGQFGKFYWIHRRRHPHLLRHFGCVWSLFRVFVCWLKFRFFRNLPWTPTLNNPKTSKNQKKKQNFPKNVKKLLTKGNDLCILS